ncbi:hypothetical protein Tco_0421083 [Tanacetum coccineum]
MAKKPSFPAVDLSVDDDNIETEEDLMTTDSSDSTFQSLDRNAFGADSWTVYNKVPMAYFRITLDSEDSHGNIRTPDASPSDHSGVKRDPTRMNQVKTTESSAGSGSRSMKDVLNEELRQKIQAGKSAYEAKKIKEQSATELNELQILTIDADSLPEPKKTIIKNKQAQIMAKYQL